MSGRRLQPVALLACCLLAVSSLPSLAVGAETGRRPAPAVMAEGGSPRVAQDGGRSGMAATPPPSALRAQPSPSLPADAPAPQPAREAVPQVVPALDPRPGTNEMWVEVSVGEQAVRVHRGDRVLRDMPASTGRPATPTPLGTFRVVGRGEWFYNPKYGAGGLWWVSFVPSGEYLFHSTTTDDRRRLLPEAVALLGRPASRGCVRLAVDDARWVYQHVPAGTRVLIHAATGPLAAAFSPGDET